MQGKPVSLIDWLKECSWQQPSDFPRDSVNYYERFMSIANYLNVEVHPNIEKMAMLVDGGLLTDHGPDHIKTVIRRASELIYDPQAKLRPYEAYILLLAIHFHDVGNYYGRKGHEKENSAIMQKCKMLMGNDSIESHVISKIAEAHGGGSRDTISTLSSGDAPLNNKTVRMQLLAALLRFADELSDDTFRANRFGIEMDRIPPSSAIFHRYAYHLHSVSIDTPGRSIVLSFAFSEEIASRKFGKQSEEVFLLDEIFARTMKMHLERLYCSRFMREVAPVEKINVKIEIFDNEYKAVLKNIEYQLKETGYPSGSEKDIFSLCPEIKEESGESLKTFLAKRRNP